MKTSQRMGLAGLLILIILPVTLLAQTLGAPQGELFGMPFWAFLIISTLLLAIPDHS